MPTSLTLEKDPLPTYKEVWWAPEPIRTFRRREKSYEPTQIWTPYWPVHSLVIIPVILLQIPNNNESEYKSLKRWINGFQDVILQELCLLLCQAVQPLDYYTFQETHSWLAQPIDSVFLLACMYDARSKVLSGFAEEWSPLRCYIVNWYIATSASEDLNAFICRVG
jgi:hypothetical protein